MSAVNWLDNQTLTLEPAIHCHEPLVRATQFSGSMHFQFDMTPEGARAMAAELLAKADEAEAMVARECVA